jgi:hypothetical protein
MGAIVNFMDESYGYPVAFGWAISYIIFIKKLMLFFVIKK